MGEDRGETRTYLWLQAGQQSEGVSTPTWTPTADAPVKEFSSREMLRGEQGHGQAGTPKDAVWDLSLGEDVAVSHF